MQFMLAKRTQNSGGGYTFYLLKKLFTEHQPSLDSTMQPNGPTTSMGGNDYAFSEESYSTETQAGGSFVQKFWRCFSKDQHSWKITNVSNTKWYWAKLYTPKAIYMQSFGINVNSSPQRPAKVRLYGSNDDRNYDLISNELTLETNDQLQKVEIIKTAAYSYFKLEAMPLTTEAMSIKQVEFTGRYMRDFMPWIEDQK